MPPLPFFQGILLSCIYIYIYMCVCVVVVLFVYCFLGFVCSFNDMLVRVQQGVVCIKLLS